MARPSVCGSVPRVEAQVPCAVSDGESQQPSRTDVGSGRLASRVFLSWRSVVWESRCLFRRSLRDVTFWSMACELPTQSPEAAVLLRLGGAVRELIRELEAKVLQRGQLVDLADGAGAQLISGLAVILRA